MSEWQPIETAPDDQPIFVARFDGATMCWGHAARRGRGVCRLMLYDLNGKSIPAPTHWMPLPDPPRNPP